MLGAPSFSQPCLCIQPSLQSPTKSVSLLQSIFTSLFHPCFSTKSSLQSPLTLLLYLSNVSPPNNLHQKIFFLSQPFIQFRLRQGTKKIGSLVRNDTVLIFPFLLKVWTVITGLTITDFLSFRFTFYGISAFFKCNFCLAPLWKINWPR